MASLISRRWSTSVPWATCVALLPLVAGGDDGDDTPTTVTLQSPDEAVAQARADFCDATAAYVEVLDTYGQLLDDSGVTVGDVQSGGEELVAAEDDVVAAAQTYDDTVAAAEATAAEVAATATTVEGAEPTTSATFPPLASNEAIERVQKANDVWQETLADVDASTPLDEATVEVTSAAYQLEVATALLFVDAGCLEDPEGARVQVASYVSALQTDLTEGGYYTGAIDGIYGPETMDAVRQLQADSGLPVTGLPDPATQEALSAALASQQAASIAALQGILTATGYYSGPIDGIWSAEVQAAVAVAQSAAGQEPTGTITPETLAALQAAIAAGGGLVPSTTATTAPETTTTAPAETTTTSG
jgi:hypothetical protein